MLLCPDNTYSCKYHKTKPQIQSFCLISTFLSEIQMSSVYRQNKGADVAIPILLKGDCTSRKNVQLISLLSSSSCAIVDWPTMPTSQLYKTELSKPVAHLGAKLKSSGG